MAQAQLVAGVVGAAAVVFGYQQFFATPAEVAPDYSRLTNRAFVFVKPHAATDKTAELVSAQLKAKGMTVLSEGDISSKDIDEKKLIDQHYYAIASKATILKPEEMNVPADKFQEKFKTSWDAALKDGKVMNALDACKAMNIDAAQMAKLWGEAKKNNKLIKFGGGFYCAEIKGKYVFNGFFMEMRNAFTAPGKKIHYYDVEWDPTKMSWEHFRANFLGPTDPKEAPKDSLRGVVLQKWKELGLAAEPNVGDNAVHASASPFEGLAERMNWLGVKCQDDQYCSSMVKAGIPESVIEHWTRDPQVVISEDKKKKSLFDSLEDLDAAPCMKKAQELAKWA
uniref:Nucleoside-diphosphate kinase n=1 Tax=Neobodo designis TaxID=312471 RepID=A0A7S1LER7_NEODS|mmetsp:Transcript_19486/g.60512  ORF Transcript_19486/g.60512 Transcript_19486/m.60512 type:complete len:338 (+) Transcript_19486:44-1057(+)